MIRYIEEDAIISPQKVELNADVAVTTFSTHLMDLLLDKTQAKKETHLPGGVEIDVYIFEHNGKRIAVYQTPVGAPAAVGAMEEIYASGVKHIIAFGICGALIDTPVHTLIVPTRAYRDEGTSNHYSPVTDFVEVKNGAIAAEAVKAVGANALSGYVWTTDGFYRETRTRMNEMKDNGCICVDMECSVLQTVADYRGKQFYTFFITADSLAGDAWEPNDILRSEITDPKSAAVCAAVGLAHKLAK